MSKTKELLVLEEGKTYVVKVFIGDSGFDFIVQGLQDASRVSKANIVVLPVKDVSHVEFMEKVTETNDW